MVFPIGNILFYFDSGPFVTGLEYATDRKAEVVGKPERRFFVDAIKDLDCDVHQTVMIGDVRVFTSRRIHSLIMFLSMLIHGVNK